MDIVDINLYLKLDNNLTIITTITTVLFMLLLFVRFVFEVVKYKSDWRDERRQYNVLRVEDQV